MDSPMKETKTGQKQNKRREERGNVGEECVFPLKFPTPEWRDAPVATGERLWTTTVDLRRLRQIKVGRTSVPGTRALGVLTDHVGETIRRKDTETSSIKSSVQLLKLSLFFMGQVPFAHEILRNKFLTLNQNSCHRDGLTVIRLKPLTHRISTPIFLGLFS